MNYKKHYEKLIEKARNRKLDCYKEAHHIIPKCIGGKDNKENLIDLTAREHFIAHLLLIKINPGKFGLIKAVNMMCVSSDNQERSMNRMYGWLKEEFAKAQSESQKGEGNSQFGTMWICNIELQEAKKIPKGDVPEGWVKGRSAWKKTIKVEKKRKKEDEAISRQKKLNDKIEILRKQYSIYRQEGFEKFVDITKYRFSKQNLVQQFCRYLEEFVPQNGKTRKN